MTDVNYKFQIWLPSLMERGKYPNPAEVMGTVNNGISFPYGDSRVHVWPNQPEKDLDKLTEQVRSEVRCHAVLITQADRLAQAGLLPDGKLYCGRTRIERLIGEPQVLFAIADTHLKRPFRVAAQTLAGVSPILLAEPYRDLPDLAKRISVLGDYEGEDRITANKFSHALLNSLRFWELADVFEQVRDSLRR